MCVALEHAQQNCDQFLKSATREQVRQAEISISKVRSLAEQLEKEFKVLETFAIQKRRQLTEGPFALTACGQARAIPAAFALLSPACPVHGPQHEKPHQVDESSPSLRG